MEKHGGTHEEHMIHIWIILEQLRILRCQVRLRKDHKGYSFLRCFELVWLAVFFVEFKGLGKGLSGLLK
jgi:hypothetical protein